MISSIPDKFVIVKQNIPILQAIERYGLNLTRKGSYFWLVCPFHPDKNPSLCIYEDTNSFYCYGCNEHGDVIDFTAKYFNISPLDAVHKLASDFGINLPDRKIDKKIMAEAKQAEKRRREDKALYDAFVAERNEIYDKLCTLYQLYRKIQQSITDISDLAIPEVIESLQNECIIEYWIDTLREGSIEEQLFIIEEAKKWIKFRK